MEIQFAFTLVQKKSRWPNTHSSICHNFISIKITLKIALKEQLLNMSLIQTEHVGVFSPTLDPAWGPNTPAGNRCLLSIHESTLHSINTFSSSFVLNNSPSQLNEKSTSFSYQPSDSRRTSTSALALPPSWVYDSPGFFFGIMSA